MLIDEMIRSVKDAAGFVTTALEKYWSPWFVKWQMEKLEFRSLDPIKVTHKAKRKDHSFSTYLMWMPVRARTRRQYVISRNFCAKHSVLHIRCVIYRHGMEIFLCSGKNG